MTEKYQGLQEQLEQMWKVRSRVFSVVIGALGAVTHELEEWFQQIPGATSEVSAQKSVVPGLRKTHHHHCCDLHYISQNAGEDLECCCVFLFVCFI